MSSSAPSPSSPSSSSSSSSSSLPSFHAYGTRARVLLVVVPLVLVFVVALAADSYNSASWFSPHALFFSPSVVDGAGSGAANDGGVAVGNSTLRSSGSASNASLQLPPASRTSPTTPQPAPSEDHERSTRKVPKPLISTSRDAKLERLERGLAKARAAIREALRNSAGNATIFDKDYVPQGIIYRNAHAFHRSYLEMEKLFKVHIYEEGEPPLFHDGPSRSIYSSEGRFIYALEQDNHFRTSNPDLAHVHFLPFSLTKMRKILFRFKSRVGITPMTTTIADYINLVAGRYPYWNRSLGADHFFVSCHDWAPRVSKTVPLLYKNSIRVMCNANTSEGFDASKDAALPEINILNDDLVGMVGGPPPSERPILAFFAGRNHGPVRPLLLKEWKGKDEDVQVHEYLPEGVSYLDYMRRSKFCLCPSGHEVASPRIVEAVYVGCVPVLINSHYAPPFADVLNWKAFSVDVPLEDIPNLKKILMSIPQRKYLRMQKRVELLRRHFMLHGTPQRFDMFHMILHSIWLRRLNIRIHPRD